MKSKLIALLIAALTMTGVTVAVSASSAQAGFWDDVCDTGQPAWLYSVADAYGFCDPPAPTTTTPPTTTTAPEPECDPTLPGAYPGSILIHYDVTDNGVPTCVSPPTDLDVLIPFDRLAYPDAVQWCADSGGTVGLYVSPGANPAYPSGYVICRDVDY